MEETCVCQNCKQNFRIAPEDFLFYEKIKTPAPTFCSPCRLQRRLAARNERSLYKRECLLCGKSVVAMFSSDKSFKVFCKECWWSDKWDAMSFGRGYDFSKPFFTQFRELLERVPRPNVIGSNAVNSDYCNYFGDLKNCYLCFGSIAVEDCLYGSPYESRNCVDTYLARECEYCYEVIDCEKLSKCSFVQDCANSMNLLYCFDCKNCQDCIGSAGLRNKKYFIYNNEYPREEFMKKREEIINGGRDALNKVARTLEEIKATVPHRFATVLHSANVSGDHIVQSKNAHECFDVKRTEDSKYCIRMIDAKDAHDTNYCEFLELCYDYIGFWKNNNAKYSNTCGECSEVTYCDFCSGSSYLFGCIGLRSKQYCILNKQYSKADYLKLVEQIRKQMNDMPYKDKNGRVYVFGEFPPIELAPFAYNESVAQEYFPLTKEEALMNGFSWREPDTKDYKIIIQPEELPVGVNDIQDSILESVIGCEHQGKCNEQCTTAFKIIPQELEFYKKMNLPIPKLCPNCRHYERLRQRNPLKLWHRKCQCAGAKSENGIYKNTAEHFHNSDHCPNEFETSYLPDRKEIIYCEVCYQEEVI